MGKLGKTILLLTLLAALAGFSGPSLGRATPPDVINIARAPIPIQVLVQSPAETKTDLQVIFLLPFIAGEHAARVAC
jgi:hypothetical protein